MALFNTRLVAETSPVSLDVHFKLTDLDYHPIPAAKERVVLGNAVGWQGADAGHRFVTDAKGEARYGGSVKFESRSRKRPTNFVDSLFSRAEQTDFLQVSAELEFAGYRWLYVIDLSRFLDGDVLLDHLQVYSRDAAGNFTVKAEASDQGWKIADLGGLMLTTPGHEAWEFRFHPDETDAAKQRWILDLSFRRSPEPMRR